MIIPVKCFTCGKVIGDKYRYFKETVRESKLAEGKNPKETIYLDRNSNQKTIEGKTMDALGITRICCRRHFLTHIDITC
jgi:DNA-directed RNA polymerase subunit N